MKSLNTPLQQINIPLNKNQVENYDTCCSFKDWFSHLNGRLKFLFIIYVCLVILSFYVVFLLVFRSFLHINYQGSFTEELSSFFERIFLPNENSIYYWIYPVASNPFAKHSNPVANVTGSKDSNLVANVTNVPPTISKNTINSTSSSS